MAIKDLVIRESYTAKDGTEKTSWNRIGILFEAKEKQYIKLFHIPGVLVSVFEQKKKEAKPEQTGEGWPPEDQG